MGDASRRITITDQPREGGLLNNFVPSRAGLHRTPERFGRTADPSPKSNVVLLASLNTLRAAASQSCIRTIAAPMALPIRQKLSALSNQRSKDG